MSKWGNAALNRRGKAARLFHVRVEALVSPFFSAPLQTLFYQVFFSAPLLFLMSTVLEGPIVSGFSFVTGFSVFYQCIIVAFISYLIWFELIHRYPVSLLHAFSFFTPVFGVFLSGALILGELISPRLIVALTLVSLGMVLVNRQAADRIAED